MIDVLAPGQGTRGRRTFGIGVFCVLAVVLPVAQIGRLQLSWRGWLLVCMLIAAAVGFGVILKRNRLPSAGPGMRWLAYGCAVVATQGLDISNAFYAVVDGASSPAAPSVREVLFGVATALMSLWGFALVRSWASAGIRSSVSRRSDSRSPMVWYADMSLAVTLVLSGTLTFAGIGQTIFESVFGVTTNAHMHAKAGSTADWIAVTVDASFAGLREEPVYVGIAALLFASAYRSPKRFVPVAAGTSAARTLLHIYYATGQQHTALSLASIALWCTIWSTINLAVFYHFRNLAPLILGHALANVVITNSSPTWHPAGAWAVAIECAELAAFVGVLIGLCIYAARTVRTAFMDMRAHREASRARQ